MSHLAHLTGIESGIMSIAWLAGLYEGEGCLSRHREGGWALTIASTDRDVIERAKLVAGVGHITFKKRQMEHWQDQYVWRVTRSDDLVKLVEKLRPHLGIRRGRTADELLRWNLDGRPRIVNDVAREQVNARMRRHRAARKANA